ncbi:hypothetical protein ACKWTF_005704 [Chironomus riparius]
MKEASVLAYALTTTSIFTSFREFITQSIAKNNNNNNACCFPTNNFFPVAHHQTSLQIETMDRNKINRNSHLTDGHSIIEKHNMKRRLGLTGFFPSFLPSSRHTESHLR